MQDLVPEIRAGATLPLIIQQRMIGALGISFTKPRAFSADDRIHLQLVAHQCAQAIERAWLYESERRAHADAEAAVRTRDDLLTDIGLGRKIATIVAKRLARLMAERGMRPNAVTMSMGLYAAPDSMSAQRVLVDNLVSTLQVIALALAKYGRTKMGTGEGLFHAFANNRRNRGGKTVTLA